METLPIEIVEMITQQLSLQDLARCSAVCRGWREIFSEDSVWKPRCDPELEEPLRTTPCVVTPAFVAPEVEDSTLSPISRWKLAFLREKHLWKNWSREIMDKNENVVKLENNDIVDVDFLTGSLVVVWYHNRIEIVDVSVVPTAIVAKTVNPVNIGGHRVIGSATLLVENLYSIQVFNVVIHNETIELKHTILLTRNWLSSAFVVKEHIYLLESEGSKLKVFFLDTGKLLEEQCPGKYTPSEIVRFVNIKSSPTSDFVACLLVVRDRSNGKDCCKYYIYSVKQLAFLPGPVAEYEDYDNDFALLGHWLAIGDYKTLTVYNFQTQKVVFSYEYHKCTSFRLLESCKDCFVFKELSDNHLNLYFPSHRSLTTLCEKSNEGFRIIHNKFIEVFHGRNRVRVWKPSGHTVEKCAFSVSFGYKTNRLFTKVLNRKYLKGKWAIDYVW